MTLAGPAGPALIPTGMAPDVLADLRDWPFAALYAFFLFGALARSAAIYGAGRGLRAGAERSPRLLRRLDGRALADAERLVARWGAPVVALSFLTIGVQTAINAAAGALRMPLRRYVPAALCGSLVWAALYTTVGFAAFEAWVTDEAGPWLLLAGVPVLTIAVTTVLLRRRRRAPDDPPPPQG